MTKTKEHFLFIAVAITFILAFLAYSHSNDSSTERKVETAKDRILESGTIRAGYIIYDPLVTINKDTGELSGFSYDLANEVAKKLNLKIEWVGESSWGTFIEDVKIGRYDMIGTQVWANAARAKEVYLTTPTIYSPVYMYVKAGDGRFNDDLNILNSEAYTISTLDGEMSTFIAKENFPHARTFELTQSSSLAEILLNVIYGKADVAFTEPLFANKFLETNPGSIQRVSDKTVRLFPNTYILPQGEDELLHMWNIAQIELINEGKVESLLDKYGMSGQVLTEQSVYH